MRPAHALLGVAATACLALAVPARAQQCLPFRAALDAALGFDPRIETASAQADQARAGAIAARSESLPQVSLFGQTGLGDTAPIDRTRDDQAGVQVNQDLYTFGARKAARAAAAARLEAAAHGVEEAEIDVAEGIALAYLDLLRTQGLAALAAEQERTYARDAELSADRLARRVITLTDASQIRARFAVARSDTLNAEVQAEAARVRLSVLTDRPVECVVLDTATAFLEPDASAVLSLSPRDATRRAFRRSATVGRARAGVKAASASLTEANRRRLPTFSANAFALTSQQPVFDPVTRGSDDEWTEEGRVGLSVQGNLYSGGRGRAQSLDARARLRQARADEDLQLLILEDRVRRALAEARAAQSVGLALLEASAEAKTQLDATLREYERGTKTLTDLVLATEGYYGAARQETNARFGFYSSLVRLYAAMNLLIEPGGF